MNTLFLLSFSDATHKNYQIFGLTDEAYAILVNHKGECPKNFYFYVIALSHAYWIIGSLLGVLLGLYLPIHLAFLKFVLTGLFVVMTVEQAYEIKSAKPFIIGASASILSLIVYPKAMLLLAIVMTTVMLIVNLLLTGKST